MINAAACAAYLQVVLLLVMAAEAVTFRIENGCSYTVWPGLLTGAGRVATSVTGFALKSGQSMSMSMPTAWSGRLWGRTGCNFSSSTGVGTCASGDCAGRLQCAGSGATPPATLAEFTLQGKGAPQDFYDVSLVDGFNVPMSVKPTSIRASSSGSGNSSSTVHCGVAACAADLNKECPSELQVHDGSSSSSSKSIMSSSDAEAITRSAASTSSAVDACKSACLAFNTPRYCCSGAYATPDTCKNTSYSRLFKKACPTSYSYAYDDASSIFTCSATAYTITFCPSSSKLDQAETWPRTRSTATSTSSAAASPDRIGNSVWMGLLLSQTILLWKGIYYIC